jgi:hypothetical protein
MTELSNFYRLVPGTEILHSTTDVYELTDEAESVTHTVKLQADNGGVYIESGETDITDNTKRITECLSISNKQIAIVVAKRILELYGVA